MRIVLIDDHNVVKDNLKTLLSIYVPDAEIVGEADGVKTGIECLKTHKPDLLLLDVEMGDGTGFDLLAIYGEIDFKVIFITGHDAYAIKAIKFSAIDYLLKPVDPELLSSALARAKQAIDTSEQNLKVSTLFQNRETPLLDQKIVLKDSETVYLVAIKDIIRCESQANYTKFFLVGDKMVIVSKTLKEYDSLFESKFFFRAHQSHLVNLMHFDRYEKKDGGIVHMKDGSMLPVAVRKKDSLMNALDLL
ncbi:MAG: LytTR family DNA-binding domain-containing protein [Cyclobacteriaceae bacterium]